MRGSFQAQSQYNVTRGHQFVAKGMENVVWETIKTTTTTTTTTTTIIILLLYHFYSIKIRIRFSPVTYPWTIYTG